MDYRLTIALVCFVSSVVLAILAWLVAEVRKLARFRIPGAVTDMRMGPHQVLIVRVTSDITPEVFAQTHAHLVKIFAAAGVRVPILLFDRNLDFSVSGPGVADSGQRLPA